MDILYHIECRANWIKRFGITYKKNCTLCIGSDENDFPIYAKIIDTYIIQHKTEAVAYAQVYKTMKFNTHYHVFEVIPTSDFQVLPLEFQQHPYPLHVYEDSI